jgi:hypothetical protein
MPSNKQEITMNVLELVEIVAALTVVVAQPKSQ